MKIRSWAHRRFRAGLLLWALCITVTLTGCGGIKVLISQMSASGFAMYFRLGDTGEAYIERTISGTCETTSAESGDITLSLHVDNDETGVNISGVTAKLTSDIKQSGVSAKMIITLELYTSEEELMVRGSETETSGSAHGQGSNFSTGMSMDSKAGWNENIWKPWDGTKETLKLAGE